MNDAASRETLAASSFPSDPSGRSSAWPEEWTVRRARDAYLAENGFSVASYDDPWTEASLFGLPIRVPNTAVHRRAIRLHDLHHVATGYGTDHVGEGEISAWEARRGLRAIGLYVGSIVTAGALLGFVLAPRRTLAAFRASKAAPLWALATGGAEGDGGARELDYERLLDMSVGDLRAMLGVPAEGLATAPRALHARAPRERRR